MDDATRPWSGVHRSSGRVDVEQGAMAFCDRVATADTFSDHCGDLLVWCGESPGLDFIRFSQGGLACFSAQECTTLHGVEAPATLVLEDSTGRLTFTIEQREFKEIESLASSPRLAEEVEDALAGRDCEGFDVLLSMTYQLHGRATRNVPEVGSCGTSEGYAIRELFRSVRRLKEKYLECPPWEEPPGFNLSMDPLPQRALCWFCYGKCSGQGDAAAAPPTSSAGHVAAGGTVATERDSGM